MFDRSMRDKLTPATAERRLREALDQGQFRLYYQPIVSLWTKRLVGAEALLRWHDPNRGIVGPDEFMAALEQTGLIVPVGNWVLDEVCRQVGPVAGGLPGPPGAEHEGQRLAPPARAVRVRPAPARVPGDESGRPGSHLPRGERAGPARARRVGVVDAPRGQGARRQPGARRLRHRLLVARLPAHDQPRPARASTGRSWRASAGPARTPPSSST